MDGKKVDRFKKRSYSRRNQPPLDDSKRGPKGSKGPEGVQGPKGLKGPTYEYKKGK